MIDLGWSELLVIGVVALIVVGPRDLPVMFRRLGEFTGKARAMAREFTSAMDKAADESGMRDMQKNLRDAADPKKMGLDAVKDATSGLSKWDSETARAGKPGGKTGGSDGAAPEPRAAAAASAGEARERMPAADSAAATSAAPQADAKSDEKTA